MVFRSKGRKSLIEKIISRAKKEQPKDFSLKSFTGHSYQDKKVKFNRL